MERTLLSWNLANWLTVVLMAAAGYAVLALIAQAVNRAAPTAASTGY